MFDSNTGALLQSFFSPIPRNLFPVEYATAVGNKVAIAASSTQPSETSINPAVYLFDSITGELLQTLPSPDTADNSATFGTAMIAVGNDILVGAAFADRGRGAAYLFDGNTGSLIRKFSNPNPPDFNLYTNDGFGSSLAVTGNDILIGAKKSYESQGAVYRFNNTTGNLIETYLGKVPPGGFGSVLGQPAKVSSFGEQIAIVGDKVAITQVIPRFRSSDAIVSLF